jgi:hypothetical protein
MPRGDRKADKELQADATLSAVPFTDHNSPSSLTPPSNGKRGDMLAAKLANRPYVPPKRKQEEQWPRDLASTARCL